MKSNGENILIIGGGPSGIAAAVQLTRQGHKPTLFEKARLGGLLRNAGLVENYPGFPDGIGGVELADLFQQQLKKWDVSVITEEVTSLDYDNDSFIATTAKQEYSAPIAVIATGTEPLRFADIDFPDNIGDTVSHEISHIRQERGKRITIVGGGDAAFDYALTMSAHNQVTIINRTESVKCLPLLFKRVQDVPAIQYCPNTQLEAVESSPCGSLRLICQNGQQAVEIGADYLVLAIGRQPRMSFLSGGLAQSLEQHEKRGVLYRIGDVINGNFRQTAIAVGDGVRVAMQIDRYLRGVES